MRVLKVNYWGKAKWKRNHLIPQCPHLPRGHFIFFRKIYLSLRARVYILSWANYVHDYCSNSSNRRQLRAGEQDRGASPEDDTAGCQDICHLPNGGGEVPPKACNHQTNHTWEGWFGSNNITGPQMETRTRRARRYKILVPHLVND